MFIVLDYCIAIKLYNIISNGVVFFFFQVDASMTAAQPTIHIAQDSTSSQPIVLSNTNNNNNNSNNNNTKHCSHIHHIKVTSVARKNNTSGSGADKTSKDSVPKTLL